MFQKLVAIEPINIDQEAKDLLSNYAHEVKFYQDMPKENEEIIRRIGDADAVLVSYTTNIDAQVINSCKNIRYIGMCCSLYSPESANVDILAAEKRGITVKGVRDYGDEGVVEYVISELVRLLHGFGSQQWKDKPAELTEMKIGILGLGTTGLMVGKGLQFFGADVYYYSRTRKPESEKQGFKYLELEDLLKKVDILCTCLNKGVILLHQHEFEVFGNGKILINTSIAPGHDVIALKNWLSYKNNYFLCDTVMASGDDSDKIVSLSNVSCVKKTAGSSIQSTKRLGKKVIQNIETFFTSH